MSKAVTTSRHRADIPAKTPFSHLADAVSANAGTIGRRGALIAATGGLIVTMGLPASATDAHDNAPVKGHHAAKSAPKQVVADNAALTVPDAKTADNTKADGKPADSVGLKFEAEAAPKPAPKPAPEPEPATITQTAGDDTTPPASHSGSEPSNSGSTPSTTTHESTRKASTAKASSSSSSHPSTKSSSASSFSSAASSAPSSSKGGSIVSLAARYTGVRYVLGGKTPSGWDCSGYVSYVYAQAGKKIPSQTDAIRSAGTVISASEARPGDLVWSPGHVGIYAGNGTMYDAGNPRVDTSHRSYSWMGNVTYLRF